MKIEHGQNPATGLYGLADAKALKRKAIDGETSAAILAGFTYEIAGKTLHFSYDTFDQQNFADAAGAALVASSQGLSPSVTWNGYNPDGSLERLDLDIPAFLALYTQGALAHKAARMEIGGQRKAAVEAATSIAEVNAA